MAVEEGCPLSRGWEKRVAAKTAAAGAAGGVVGSVLAVLRRGPVVRYTLGTGASMAFAFGCYGSMVEAFRRLRCADDALNSALGGATAAYALVGIHQGERRKATAAALYLGAAAGLMHAADSYFGITQRLQIPTPEEAAAAAAKAERRAAEPYSGRAEGEVPPWWERWLPLRRLSDQEWADYQHEKRHGFQRRVEAVKEGGLPVLLEREQQQLQERRQATVQQSSGVRQPAAAGEQRQDHRPY